MSSSEWDYIDFSTIDAVFEGGVLDPDSHDPLSGVTPLIYAAKSGHHEIMNLLLSTSADPNHVSREVRSSTPLVSQALPLTPLEVAVQEGDTTGVQILLAAGATPTRWNRYEDGWDHGRFGYMFSDTIPLLHMAFIQHAPERAIAIATLLIDAGADPHVLDPAGYNAYIRAEGDEVLFLLEQGVDPHRVDTAGGTTLHHAALIGRDQFAGAIEHLAAAGVDPNRRDNLGDTPLHLLTRIPSHREYEEIGKAVKSLLRHGADPNMKSDDWDSPLYPASFYGMEEVVHLLIKAGAHVNAKGEEFGSAPLQQTSLHRDVRIARLLVEAGADLLVRDSDGNTMLHSAASQGYYDVVTFYLERGVDPRLVNEEGKTPLDLARESQGNSSESDHEKTTELLEEWMTRLDEED